MNNATSKFFFTFLLFVSSAALAVENFTVPVPRLRVYAQPSTLSQVLTTLNQGQTVQAGSNPAGGFKKVLITDSTGHKKIGYVAINELGGRSSSAPSGGGRSSRSYGRSGGGLHNHSVLGITGGVAYDMASKTITDVVGNQYTTSSMTGVNPEFGGFFTYPFSMQFSVKGYLMYKSTTLSGTFSSTGSPISNPVTFSITSLSFGAVGKYYLNPTGSFWVGGGLQVDWGMSATATINNGSANTLSNNQFILIQAVAGYDFQLTQSIYLTPSLGVGAVVNASPMTYEANILVDVGYRL